jgi:hypothetical protein
MGKYSKYQKRDSQSRNRIDPIWTGIGCLMIVIVPIMSWAGAVEFIKLARAQNWPFMNGLGGYLTLPNNLYGIPYIAPVASFIAGIPDFPALALFTLLFLLIISGVMSFGYAVAYRVIGPPRYTSVDAPASREHSRRYTR